MVDIQKGAFKVGLAQLAALVINTAALVWFAASMSAEVRTHTTQIAENKAQIQLQAAAVSALGKDVAEMKGTLNSQADVLNNINNAVMSMPVTTRKR